MSIFVGKQVTDKNSSLFYQYHLLHQVDSQGINRGGGMKSKDKRVPQLRAMEADVLQRLEAHKVV